MWSEKLFMSQAGITWTPETLSIRTWSLRKESALWYEIIKKCLSIKKEKSPDYENRKIFLLPVVAFRCFMIKNQRSRNARLCNASCCTLRIEIINFWDVTRLKKVMVCKAMLSSCAGDGNSFLDRSEGDEKKIELQAESNCYLIRQLVASFQQPGSLTSHISSSRVFVDDGSSCSRSIDKNSGQDWIGICILGGSRWTCSTRGPTSICFDPWGNRFGSQIEWRSQTICYSLFPDKRQSGCFQRQNSREIHLAPAPEKPIMIIHATAQAFLSDILLSSGIPGWRCYQEMNKQNFQSHNKNSSRSWKVVAEKNLTDASCVDNSKPVKRRIPSQSTINSFYSRRTRKVARTLRRPVTHALRNALWGMIQCRKNALLCSLRKLILFALIRRHINEEEESEVRNGFQHNEKRRERQWQEWKRT